MNHWLTFNPFEKMIFILGFIALLSIIVSFFVFLRILFEELAEKWEAKRKPKGKTIDMSQYKRHFDERG